MEKEYKIVEVEWEDAIAYSIKAFIKDLIEEELPLTYSCGYLIYENEEKVIIASMMYEDILEQYQVIPKKLIKKIIELKPKQEGK